MTLQQLRYLCAIADNGLSISRAARALHTSQPGISRQIRQLESQLGATLLLRRDGRISGLSESGLRVFEIARRILKDSDSLKTVGDDFTLEDSGTLTVATMHLYARALLVPAIAEFRQRHPAVDIDLRQDTPGRIFDMVYSGEADIGVVTSRQNEAASQVLLEIPCRTMPRVLITPRKHPLTRKRAISLQDIGQYPLIAFDTLLAGGWALKRAFQSQKVEMKISMRAMDATVIKMLVEAGMGISVLPSIAHDSKRDRRLAAIDVSHLFGVSVMTVLVDPHRQLRRYAYDFIQLLAPGWDRERVEREQADRTARHPGLEQES